MSLFKIRIGSYGLVLLPSDPSHVLRKIFEHCTQPAPEELYVCQETTAPGICHTECVLLRPATTKVFRLEVRGVSSAASNPTDLATCHDALIGSVVKRSGLPTGLDDSAVIVLPAPANRSPLTDPSKPTLPRIDTVHAICPESMHWLDSAHRAYVARHKFAGRSLAFKAVAGSGKTTILLQFAKQFQQERTGHLEWSSKRVGYVAFNKQLVDEFRGKCARKGLAQVVAPFTFDGLVYRVARDRHEAKYGESVPFVFHGALNPRLLTEQYSWFRGKAYRLKKCYIDRFAKFCQDPNQLEPTDKWVKQLWEDTRRGRLVTFDGLRKLAYIDHWLRGYMDTKYARVFVDEAQDLDPIMLSILTNDVQAPKVFVGDPNQQIYEWRGTVNAFEHLPERTLQMHLYKTFRMGEPATSEVSRITGIPMISGIPETTTTVTTGMTHERSMSLTQPDPVSYTYVHRTWKSLLPAAQELAKQLDSSQRLWIVDYQTQMKQVQALHERILQYGSCGDASQPDSDDLPAFLTKLSAAELAALRQTIESRLTHDPSEAVCRMYTIHRFKGLEDGIVRVASDVDRQKDANLAYVAFTRAQGQLWVDAGLSTAPLDELRLRSAASASMPERSQNKHDPFRPKSTRTPLDIVSVKNILSPRATKAVTPNLCTAGQAASVCVHEELHTFRRNTARDRGVPAYCVFGNQTLVELERMLPTSRSKLLRVHGIGKKKMADYGDAILEICARHAGHTPPKSMESDTHTPAADPSDSGATERESARTPPKKNPSGDTSPTHTPTCKSRAHYPCRTPTANSDVRAFFTAKNEDLACSSSSTRPPPSLTLPVSVMEDDARSTDPSSRKRGRTTETGSKLLLCYDIETTGFRPTVEKIIQISVQFLKCDPPARPAKHTNEHTVPTFTTLDTYTSFVQPDTDIPPRIVDYTGITDDDVAEAPIFKAIHEAIRQKVHTLCRTHSICSCVWIAHNGNQFDHKFLKHNIGMLENPSLVDTDAVPDHAEVRFEFTDTLHVAKRCWKDLPDGPPKYKLEPLYEWCKSRCTGASDGENGGAIRFHRADDDVKAMVVVIRALAEEELAQRVLFGCM